MNAASLLSIVCLLALPEPAFAEAQPPGPEHVIFADLGLHVIGLGYERTFGEHATLSVSVGLYDPWTVTNEAGDIRGAYVRVRPYVFLVGHAPEGLWVSPFVQGAVVSGRHPGGAKLGGAAAFGIGVGYAFLIADHLHIGLGAGGQFHAAEVSERGDRPSFHQLGLHVDATLGYAF